MQINLMLNGVRVSDDVAPDTLLIDFVRSNANNCNSNSSIVLGIV